MVSKTFILLDNNLLRRVYSKNVGDLLFSTLYSNSLEIDLPDIRGQESIVTAFSLLEALGFGELPSVSKISFDTFDIEKAIQLANEVVKIERKAKVQLKELIRAERDPTSDVVINTHKKTVQIYEKEISDLIDNSRMDQYNKYFDFFSQHPQLDHECLQAKYNARFEWLSDSGKKVFEQFFLGHIKNKKSTDYIAQSLAFDAIYKFNWPRELHTYRDVKIIADLFHTLKDDLGVVQTRGLKYLWHNFSARLIKQKAWDRFKRTEEEFRNEIKVASESIDLKTKEDLLDTEMLQFLVTGKMHRKLFSPVYVYTMEAPQKFIDRLALVKALIGSIRALIPEHLELPEFNQGFVVFVSGDGQIIKQLSVKDVSPLLADRE